MRALVIAGVAAVAATFAAHALAQATGGGGTGSGTSGGAGAGRGASSPSSTAVPVQPQAPVTGQTNPGVAPNAPGPSTAQTPSGVSPTVRQPGYGSSRRQPRAEDVPQPDTSSADAIKQLDKELDRKLSICRGC
jgi:hypothetical protein